MKVSKEIDISLWWISVDVYFVLFKRVGCEKDKIEAEEQSFL